MAAVGFTTEPAEAATPVTAMSTRWGLLVGGIVIAVLVLVLGACGQDSGSGAAPTTGRAMSSTTEPARSDELLAAQAAQDLFEACRADDSTAALLHVEPELRAQPWNEACGALADHGPVLTEHRPAVHDTVATVHVRLEHEALVHEEDWTFRRHGSAWQLSEVPAVLTGQWDHDAHRWLASSVPPETTVHPAGDGHDHGTHPSPTGHLDGDGHDHGAPTTVEHFDGDGHDHGGSPTTAGHGETDDAHDRGEPGH